MFFRQNIFNLISALVLTHGQRWIVSDKQRRLS